MNTTSLTRLATEQLSLARDAGSGRASVTVYGGREHDLRRAAGDRATSAGPQGHDVAEVVDHDRQP